MNRYQFVWFGWRDAWPPISWPPVPYPDRPGESYHAGIYLWMWRIGPVEIRRWNPAHLQSSALDRAVQRMTATAAEGVEVIRITLRLPPKNKP